MMTESAMDEPTWRKRGCGTSVLLALVMAVLLAAGLAASVALMNSGAFG